MGAEVLPAWDAFILSVLVLAIFAVWLLGLDERLVRPKHNSRRSRSFCEVDNKGGAMLSDPDGRLWQVGPIRQIEARIVRRDPVASRRGSVRF